jgi:hypothetical protein
MDENGVSDVYVRLGNDFNAAVAAFSAFGIDMSCVSFQHSSNVILTFNII